MSDSNVYYAVKSESGFYFIGYNKWDKQLRKARLYKQLRMAQETLKYPRYENEKLKIVKVHIEEVGDYDGK